jgi:hypothetical protein
MRGNIGAEIDVIKPALPAQTFTLRLLFTSLSEFRALRSFIALLILRGLRYKIFLRDALFSPQMPAASPKLFACYVTVVTRKLAL